MISRDAFFGAVIISVAALSFAAGRLVPTRAAVSAETIATPSVPDRGENEPSAATSLPFRVSDIATMPFRETYTRLKSASDESLRSYFTELQQVRPKPTRYAALVSFFKTLIHVKPSLTAELILQLKKDDRWPALFAIREASPPRGMHAVAEVMLGYERREISSCSWDMLAETLDEWGKNDPTALKEFLESHGDQDVERYFPKLIRNWAAYDPEAAQKWMVETVRKHPPPPAGDENLGDGWTSTVGAMAVAWVEGFLENDREAAINYVLEHAAEPGVTDAVESFSGALFTMSPDRAREFLRHLPDEQRSAALTGIARKADGFVRSDAGENTTSPRFVAEWMLSSFPESGPEYFEHVLREWKYADPQELFAWLTHLPTGTLEAVIRRFPTYVSDDKPSQDFDVIMQAPDPGLRDALLERLAREATSNGKALLGVLERSNLPEFQKIKLASLIPPEPSYSASEDSGEN